MLAIIYKLWFCRWQPSQPKRQEQQLFHLEHIIVSIHVHVPISRLDENKTGTFRSRLPYL